MNNIALLYGTNDGNTETVAEQIKDLFDGAIDMYNVAEVSLNTVKNYPFLILGTSTTGVGNLQKDWDGFLSSFAKTDLSNKKVAIFALGDSDAFPASFAQSMKVLYDAIADKTTVVGQVADEGYTYDFSEAVVDGMWVGLAIDEDNEYNKTTPRLTEWVNRLKEEFKA